MYSNHALFVDHGELAVVIGCDMLTPTMNRRDQSRREARSALVDAPVARLG
jgi:hypothetical protein